MEILFVSYNRIGDAVLSTGLLSWLAERHPDARFTVAAGPAAAPLFAAAPGVVRVIALAKRRFSLHWLGLWAATVGRRWDLVLDLRGSGLAWALAARRRRVAGPAPDDRHRLAHLAGVLGLDEPPPPRLWTGPGHERRAAALLPDGGPVLALGPTANWGGKQWPAERFAELARRLTAPGAILAEARVAVLGAAAERGAAAPLLQALPPARRLDLVGAVDLLTAYACLRRADLFVGNDSGLMHMAAAAGIPTLGLFGPSREELYGPWGPHAAAVRTGRSFAEIVGDPAYDYRRADSWMDDLPVERVERAALALWERRRGAAA